MSTSGPYATYGHHYVVLSAVSLAGVYASPAKLASPARGSQQRLHTSESQLRWWHHCDWCLLLELTLFTDAAMLCSRPFH